jgi:thiamine biosynthesis lipoprotein
MPMRDLLRLLLLCVTVFHTAQSAEFLTFDDALKLAFPDSGKVERFRPEVTADQQQQILQQSQSRAEAKLGGVYVGHSAGVIDGVAYVDHVIGRTEFITWLCVVSPAGAVRRMEVMAYREPYGGEIRDRAFLKQFEGKDASSPLRAGREIANIGGATLSVNALTDRTRFLLAFHAVAVKDAAPTWLTGRDSPPRQGGARTMSERSVPIGNAPLSIRISPTLTDGTLLDGLVQDAQRLDRVLNAWEADAELARLNRAGGGAASADLLAALLLARRCHELTAGRFDPTIFPLLTLWKHAAENGALPEPAAVAAAQARIGFSRVGITEPGHVSLPEGVTLDLSGLNKGIILDHLADRLSPRLVRGQAAILTHGGSSWRAVGDPDSDESLRTVQVRHPFDPARPHQRIVLRPGQGLGMAASSGRTLQIAGVAHSHLIDPLSGQPAPLTRAAHVIAPTAALADGLDTALCLMPIADGLKLVATLPGVSVELWDGEHVVASPGWPGIPVDRTP